MPDKYFYGANPVSNGGCCVQDEIQHFVVGKRKAGYRDYYGEGDTPEKAAEDLLKKIISDVRDDGWNHDGSQLRFFWFVRGVNYVGNHSEWMHHELRDVVRTHPNVRSLGQYINANSGNEVDGYMLVIDDIIGEDDDE